MPPPPERGHLECLRCGNVLERTTGRSIDAALALALTTFILLFPANTMSLMTVRAPLGIVSSTHLFSGIQIIWFQGWPVMALVLAAQGVLLPFIRFGSLAAVLAAIKLNRQGPWIGTVFRWSERLDLWAMADVLLLGGAIGYGRVEALIPVRIDPGGYCLIGAAFLTMLTRAMLDHRAVWRRIGAPAHAVAPDAVACVECDLVLPGAMTGKRCPRCRARLHRRRPHAMLQTTALTAAAWALLPVANYFPMSVFYEGPKIDAQTIFRGVELLFQHGFMPLGVLVFVASIGIPVSKLVALTWFLISVWHRSDRHLVRKTKIFRWVDEISRWSNMDPFTIVIFTPMVQFGQLAHFGTGGGSPAFLAMVVLSMVASRTFDPRLMWDAAEQGGHDHERAHPPAALAPAGAPAR